MRRLRTLGRWLTDWRNGATLAASLLLVVVILVVNDSIAGRREAFDQLDAARAGATRRIDLLQHRIDELVGQGQANSADLGELVGEINALRAQVEDMGGRPVVAERTVPATSSTTARPEGSPASPGPTSTTTAPPAPPPTQPPPTQPPPDEPHPTTPLPVPCGTVFVPVLCAK